MGVRHEESHSGAASTSRFPAVQHRGVVVGPGVSSVAFWVAQQILAGKQVPNVVHMSMPKSTVALSMHGSRRRRRATWHRRRIRVTGRSNYRLAGRQYAGAQVASPRRAMIATNPSRPRLTRSSAGSARRASRSEQALRCGSCAQRRHFAVRPARMVGIVGHNGAGKSTLIRVLAA